MSDQDATSGLKVQEAQLWTELHDLVDSLPEDQVATPGYFVEGWSAKDLVAHIGSWLAAAGAALQRMQSGTYRPEELDIDSMNRRFYDAMKAVPFDIVRAQGVAARNRMLREWGSMSEGTPDADAWVHKAGPAHYAEHLPRLREWVAEVIPTSP